VKDVYKNFQIIGDGQAKLLRRDIPSSIGSLALAVLKAKSTFNAFKSDQNLYSLPSFRSKSYCIIKM